MPRKKVNPVWRERVFALKGQEPRLSAEAIARRFEETAGGTGYWPSARTIRRILDEWIALSEESRRQYGYFRWPESMEDGSLPWEASAAALELLRLLRTLHPGLTFHRPPVRLVKWFWRVTLAAPDADMDIRLAAAGQLAASEAIGPPAERSTRGAEWYLAFQPWRGAKDELAYEKAQGWPGHEPIRPFGPYPSVSIEGEVSDEALADAFEVFSPGLGRSWVERLRARSSDKEEADNE